MAVIIGAGNTTKKVSEKYYQSDYQLSWEQLEWMEQLGVEEIDGHRLRGNERESESVRVYQVPWSNAVVFDILARGSVESRVVNQEEIDAWLAAGEVGPQPPPDVRISRFLPMQDVTRPWLWASTVEMVQGVGVVVEDPDGVVATRAADNSTRGGKGIYYAANDRSGATARRAEDGDGLDPPEGGFRYRRDRVPSPDNELDLLPPVERPVTEPAVEAADGTAGTVENTGRVIEPVDPVEARQPPNLFRYGPPGAERVDFPADTSLPSTEFSDGLAVFRVTFRPRPYTLRTDLAQTLAGKNELHRYVSVRQEPAVEALPMHRFAQGDPALGAVALQLRFCEPPAGVTATAPPGGLLGATVPEPGVWILPKAVWRLRLHMWPDRPLETLMALLGKVNSVPFGGIRDMPLLPAQTLLFMPWETTEETDSTGRVCHTIDIRLSYRPQGWNAYPASPVDGNPGTPFYYATFSSPVLFPDGNNAGPPVYTPADFNLLAVPPEPADYLA